MSKLLLKLNKDVGLWRGLLSMAILTISLGAQAQDPAPAAGKPRIGGNVFGGGRMANVSNTAAATTTATIDVYASTITGGVFGGNDITGTVVQATGDGNASAKITIHDKCDASTSVGEVYGGGNGYYKYKIGDTTIEIGKITDANKDNTVAANQLVEVLDAGGNKVAEFTTSAATTWGGLLPALSSTSVTIGEDADAKNKIALAEVYGGAKNACVTGTSSVKVESGTIGKVFAGNNYGGSAQSALLTINGTKGPETEPTAENFAGFGWTNVGDYVDTENGFGIGEAYGGGNAVDVTGNAKVVVNDGYIGRLFGGNNLADMIGVPDVSLKGGKINTVYGGGNAGGMKGVEGYLLGLGTYLNSSLLNGWTGLMDDYDSKTAGFQMNRFPAFMSTIVTLDAENLFVNNVYGGCRAADVDYSSYIRITNAKYVGDVYGGCDIAGAVGVGPMTSYTAPRDLKCKVFDYNDHTDKYAEDFTFPSDPATGRHYTVKQGVEMKYVGTYVTMTGGNVQGRIFGGGNGEYTYTGDLAQYADKKPWVVGANVIIEGGTINNNVYLGGNNATVGKDYTQVADKPNYYGTAVSDYLSVPSYLLIGHTVRTQTDSNPIRLTKNVYCGGRMANVYSIVDALVKNNVELSALYAGNDISGKVLGVNRTNSGTEATPVTTMLYGETNAFIGTRLDNVNGLAEADAKSKVQTYIRVEGVGTDVQGHTHPAAKIETLFGGGNGEYSYSDPVEGLVTITSKDGNITYGTVAATSAADAKPIQVSSWLDIKGDIGTCFGGGNAADVNYSNTYITGDATVGTAFAGGNSATITNRANLWFDCDGNQSSVDYLNGVDGKVPNAGNIFGGNNIAPMSIVPSLYLHRGSVVNVYGGGNEGDMLGHEAVFVDGADCVNPAVFTGEYPIIANNRILVFAATDVMLDSKYGINADGSDNPNDGLFVKNAYAGCKSADVHNSSYIRMTHAQYVDNIYGGCDVSGSVGYKPDVLTAKMLTTHAKTDEYADPADGYSKTLSVYVVKPDPAQNGAIINTIDYIPIADKWIEKPLYNASSFVLMTGGTVQGNVFGGGNGDYDYSTGEHQGLSAPFVAAATTDIAGGTVKGNVYGGGNKAEVGHIVTEDGFTYNGVAIAKNDVLNSMSYLYIGKSTLMGRSNVVIEGDVYAGCKMANVYGGVDVIALHDVNIRKLFAGNDISGSVQGGWRGTRFSREPNHITSLIGTGTTDAEKLADTKSFSGKDLTGDNANVYVRIMPNAVIGELFGGGNGDYTYTVDGGKVKVSNADGDIATLDASSVDDAKPFQQSTFLDVAGNATTAYGGGNAANVGTSNLWIVKDATVGTAFAGGNSATVTTQANLWLDTDGTRGEQSYVDGSDNTKTPNVGTVFGGNNIATMEIVPRVRLMSGSVNTVYGGGNQGDMKGYEAGAADLSQYIDKDAFQNLNTYMSLTGDNQITPKNLVFFYSTEVVVDKEAYGAERKLSINKVYGGCRAANVDLSSYVRISGATYIGDVYGGCDIAGKVGLRGNTTITESLPLYGYSSDATDPQHSTIMQLPAGFPIVNTASYVRLWGGTVSGNIYGGGNGDYDYEESEGILSAYPKGAEKVDANRLAQVEMTKVTYPSVFATGVSLEGGTVTNNVYGGGNKADVGGDVVGGGATTHWHGTSYMLIGKTKVGKSQPVVQGKVYAGCKMSDMYGIMDVIVKAGSRINEMFAGNDVSGQIKGMGRAESTLGSTFPTGWSTALYGGHNAYNNTSLVDKAQVYIRVEGPGKDGDEADQPAAQINNLFGGGNGDYNYAEGQYAGLTKPTQNTSWLDIQGKIGTVYGGGNAADNYYTNVCVIGDAVIDKAVYGGCKSADVVYSTNVMVEDLDSKKPTVNGNVFGGCDISGNVGTTKTGRLDISNIDGSIGYSKVQILGGTVTGRVFGGGNGLESADGTVKYQTTTLPTILDGTSTPNETYVYADGIYQGKTLPQVENSWVTLRGCTIGTTPGSGTHTVFGGGQGAGTRVIHNVDLLVGDGTDGSTVETIIKGISYGGSYAGFVNTDCDDHTRTMLLGYGSNTQVQGDIYGGSYGNYVRGEIQVDINNIKVGVDENAAGIYAGNNNAGQPECSASINYVGNDCNVALYGGGNMAPFYGTTRITFTKGMVGYIYGGGNHAPVYGNTIVEVLGGHVCHDVFGGGNEGGVFVNRQVANNPYGGNTLVIVRDDCLKLKDGSTTEFDADPISGNYAANYSTTELYSTKYFGYDPDADNKGYHTLTPNAAGKRTSIVIEGNVYGGGNAADVEGKATVIIGNKEM